MNVLEKRDIAFLTQHQHCLIFTTSILTWHLEFITQQNVYLSSNRQIPQTPQTQLVNDPDLCSPTMAHLLNPISGWHATTLFFTTSYTIIFLFMFSSNICLTNGSLHTQVLPQSEWNHNFSKNSFNPSQIFLSYCWKNQIIDSRFWNKTWYGRLYPQQHPRMYPVGTPPTESIYHTKPRRDGERILSTGYHWMGKILNTEIWQANDGSHRKLGNRNRNEGDPGSGRPSWCITKRGTIIVVYVHSSHIH